MRLIYVDDLIQYLKKVTVTDGIASETVFKQIITDIEQQPTVNDIDAVHYEEKEKTKQFSDILERCHTITNTTQADVFFEYSAHTNAYSVRVYEKGWSDYAKYIYI